MAVSLWESMISRMILMLLLLIIERILVPFKKKSYFISSLLCLLVADNKAKIIASWIEFLLPVILEENSIFKKIYLFIYILVGGEKRMAGWWGTERRNLRQTPH